MIMRDNFCKFCIKLYVVTPHLNHLKETVQMRGNNMWFESQIMKIIIKYSLLLRAVITTTIIVIKIIMIIMKIRVMIIIQKDSDNDLKAYDVNNDNNNDLKQ